LNAAGVSTMSRRTAVFFALSEDEALAVGNES
jgi:hypothetical protein